MRAYPLINPASSGSFAKLEINTGNQRHGGNWNTINTFYFNANYRIGKNQKEIREVDTLEAGNDSEEYSPQLSAPNKYHVVGLNIIGDKEGSFLNRTGLYGIYAWHTQLKEDLFLAGGLSLGLKNYAVHDNYINGGGSSYAPDGNVGIWMYNYNYHVGFSVNQVFNGKLTPINETSRLMPHYNFTAGKIWYLSSFFAIKPSFLIRMANEQTTDIDLTMGALFQSLLSANVNYKYKKGMTAMLGLEKVTIGESNFKMMLSYHVPFIKQNQVNINTYEITLNYFLKAKDKDQVIFQ